MFSDSDVMSVEHFPFEESVGYQIRMTHRLLQKYLAQRIEPFGVTLGMWYFLRALWDQDGLTQRELSTVVGTMEPTTLNAIKSMIAVGLVTRVRNEKDQRKINIHLTSRGTLLRKDLLPIAKEVVDAATSGFSPREKKVFLSMLGDVQANLQSKMDPESIS